RHEARVRALGLLVDALEHRERVGVLALIEQLLRLVEALERRRRRLALGGRGRERDGEARRDREHRGGAPRSRRAALVPAGVVDHRLLTGPWGGTRSGSRRGSRALRGGGARPWAPRAWRQRARPPAEPLPRPMPAAPALQTLGAERAP